MKHNQPKVAKPQIGNICMPKNSEWKTLSILVESVATMLEIADLRLVRTAIQQQNLLMLDEFTSRNSPQSMNNRVMDKEIFCVRYQVAAWLKKYPFKGTASACREAAYRKFRQTEYQCYKFNKSGFYDLLKINDVDPHLWGFLDHAREFISDILGECNVDRVLLSGRHGPGSSMCTDKGRVTPFFKWADWPYSVTPSSREYAIALIQSDQRWIGALQESYRDKFNIPYNDPIYLEHFWNSVLIEVSGNRITTVPKNNQEDRSIAIEARMNLFMQLAVDAHIRKALKKVNVNLDSQKRNQILAKLGSLCGDLATLDLRSASDSIALMLVELTLPPQWFDLLWDLRSPSGEIDGDIVQYEKISSMGNGYTFALESLLFSAIVHGVCTVYNIRHNYQHGQIISLKNHCAVYGDDIIVPIQITGDVVTALIHCGFSINTEKSFTQGPFRESCGADFFCGFPVRPIFFKGEVADVKDLYSIVNRLRTGTRSDLHILFPARQELADWFETRLTPYQRTFVGPPSFEEFDTYLHKCNPPKGVFSDGCYEFRRVVFSPLDIAAKGTKFWKNNFLFRKLMATLRPIPVKQRWDTKPWDFIYSMVIGSSGSVFSVTKRVKRSEIPMRTIACRASIWPNTQTEFLDPLH